MFFFNIAAIVDTLQKVFKHNDTCGYSVKGFWNIIIVDAHLKVF